MRNNLDFYFVMGGRGSGRRYAFIKYLEKHYKEIFNERENTKKSI